MIKYIVLSLWLTVNLFTTISTIVSAFRDKEDPIAAATFCSFSWAFYINLYMLS